MVLIQRCGQGVGHPLSLRLRRTIPKVHVWDGAPPGWRTMRMALWYTTGMAQHPVGGVVRQWDGAPRGWPCGPPACSLEFSCTQKARWKEGFSDQQQRVDSPKNRESVAQAHHRDGAPPQWRTTGMAHRRCGAPPRWRCGTPARSPHLTCTRKAGWGRGDV